MSGSNSVERDTSAAVVERARADIERAETGDVAGLEGVEQARDTDSGSVEAVEQEASEAPEGRGLSR